METTNGTNGPGRIEFLKQKEREIRARLAAEQAKQQKAKQKSLKREFSDLGETLCSYASQSPPFRAALREMVATAITVAQEPTRKRLSDRGWL
jgi:hypothetical protein